MATTSIRWIAVNRVVELLTSSPLLTGVMVSPGWPGEQTARSTGQMVWVDDIDGNVSIPVMVGGRKQRNDDFEIPLEIRVVGLLTLDDTMRRLTEIIAVIENTLAEDTSLNDLDGVLSAEITRERLTSAMSPEGPLGFAQVVVAVSTRLL